MTFGRLTIRHVACLGPGKKDAAVDFVAGANAIIGDSDTGKSYVLELIDFMLGAEKLGRELREAAGYDTVLMGLETSDGAQITLRRAMAGGDMHVLEGLVETRTGGSITETLVENESKKGPRTISQFYLEKLGIGGSVLRAKKAGTERLSIRTLSKLALISETRIIEQQSPILSGQFARATAEKSLFKLLISGVDDSALISYVADAKSVAEKQERLSAGRELVAQQLAALREQGLDEDGLRADLLNVEVRLSELRAVTVDADDNLVTVRRRLRRLSETRELAEQRKGELAGLIARFSLLDEHYVSDMERLQAIAEAAEALDSLAPGPCPLCGAPAEAHDHSKVCEADLPALSQAARAEADRIRKLHDDLATTIARARAEDGELDAKLAEISRQYERSLVMRSDAEQSARSQRQGYTAIVEEWTALKDRLRAFDAIRELQASIAQMEQDAEDAIPAAPDVSAPRSDLDDFAQEVGSILHRWGVPGTQRVFFDAKEHDIQLDGKLRGSQGKGLRALTHAAFVIGLMTYCLKNNRPHPGFVVVDSPLLSYRGDVVEEDPYQDLKRTSVDQGFYRWLATELPAGQVVVIENRDAPDDVMSEMHIHQFLGASGDRYGFFPRG